jgi:hypothetical protein
MNREEFIADVASLVAELIPQIDDDYRASECECKGPFHGDDHDADCLPSMLLTIGADADNWSYQTGDNSYSGGAYGYAVWGVGYIYRDSDPREVAKEIADDIDENDESIYDESIAPIFDDVTAE